MGIAQDIDRVAARSNTAAPVRLGQRYREADFFLEAGNTVVCHLDMDAAGHEAVLCLRRSQGSGLLVFRSRGSLLSRSFRFMMASGS